MREVSLRAAVKFAAEVNRVPETHRHWCEDLIVILAAEVARLESSIVLALEDTPIDREKLINALLEHRR